MPICRFNRFTYHLFATIFMVEKRLLLGEASHSFEQFKLDKGINFKRIKYKIESFRYRAIAEKTTIGYFVKR